MAIKTIDTKYLSDIADAIRDKTGKTEGLEIVEMAGEIAEITGDDPFAPVSPFTYTVDAISGATYGFALNANGYYESQNKGVNSSYAICRVNLNVATACDIVFDVINYAESNYDYAVFGALDTALALSNSADTSAKENFKGRQSADVVNVTYSGVSAGNHYIDVKFIKDVSQHNNNDSVQFKIQEQQGGLSQETIDKILAADSDLVAENIAEGVDIFGIVGTHSGGDSIIEAWTGTVNTTGGPLGSEAPGLYYTDETLTTRVLGGDGGFIDETITIAANTALFFFRHFDVALNNAENITADYDEDNIVIRPTANNFSVSRA